MRLVRNLYALDWVKWLAGIIENKPFGIPRFTTLFSEVEQCLHFLKLPMLFDLRESGSPDQDADVAAFIHPEEYYDRENEDVKGKAEI